MLLTELLTMRMRSFTSMVHGSKANNFEADFVMVGTNVLRVDRGKPPLGSVPWFQGFPNGWGSSGHLALLQEKQVII